MNQVLNFCSCRNPFQLFFIVLSISFSFFISTFILPYLHKFMLRHQAHEESRGSWGSPHRGGRLPTHSDSTFYCRSTSIITEEAAVRPLYRLPCLWCQAPFAFSRPLCLSAAECGSLCPRLWSVSWAVAFRFASDAGGNIRRVINSNTLFYMYHFLINLKNKKSEKKNL